MYILPTNTIIWILADRSFNVSLEPSFDITWNFLKGFGTIILWSGVVNASLSAILMLLTPSRYSYELHVLKWRVYCRFFSVVGTNECIVTQSFLFNWGYHCLRRILFYLYWSVVKPLCEYLKTRQVRVGLTHLGSLTNHNKCFNLAGRSLQWALISI